MWRRRLTTAFLIAVFFLTLDLLCLMGVQMTVQEHECCEKMAGDCGRIPMPDMHACCRSAAPHQAVLVSRTADYPELRVMILPAVIPDLDLLYDNVHARSWVGFDSPTSPTLISLDSFDILRI
jgi:hypothetical protein